MAVPTRHDIHHDPHRYDGLADRATAAEQCTPLTLALLQPRSDQRLGPRRPLTGVGSPHSGMSANASPWCQHDPLIDLRPPPSRECIFCE